MEGLSFDFGAAARPIDGLYLASADSVKSNFSAAPHPLKSCQVPLLQTDTYSTTRSQRSGDVFVLKSK